MRKKRLTLNRETLRRLTSPALRAAVGGETQQGVSCTETDYCSGTCAGTGITAYNCQTEYGCPRTNELSICIDCEI